MSLKREGIEVSIIVFFIISLVVATIITNVAQRLFMKVMGADAMFFSMKKKLIAIVIIALLLTGLVINMFGS